MIGIVDYSQVISIRKEVLWPKKDLNFVKMPFDKSQKIIHLGIFNNSDIVNVVSLNFKDKSMQICQFATLEKYQGKGYGKMLMKYIFEIAKNNNVNRIWCNSRIEKCGFYKKYGLSQTGELYYRNGRKICKMELLFKTNK